MKADHEERERDPNVKTMPTIASPFAANLPAMTLPPVRSSRGAISVPHEVHLPQSETGMSRLQFLQAAVLGMTLSP